MQPFRVREYSYIIRDQTPEAGAEDQEGFRGALHYRGQEIGLASREQTVAERNVEFSSRSCLVMVPYFNPKSARPHAGEIRYHLE